MAISEIHLLHHTHVDVGYTDLQPVIFRTHVEYLEQALDLCRDTDDYPDDARFRWISEFSWPVVEFLRRRPERSEELFARLREGRLELAGLFLDPTELMDRRAFEMSLLPALQLARQQGFAVTTAMTTDIPGQGWGLADILAEQGLQYLSVSPNAMVSKPLQVERPFWWVGPKGRRVLVWFTDWRKGWYCEGHVLGFPQGLGVARDKVLAYLELLSSEGYPWEVLALHFAADNYPPSSSLADLVRTWNEQENLPRLRISTNAEFFGRLQELHGDAFPEYQLAWPDWWSEGLGSAAYETALSRETHCRMLRLEKLLSRLGETRDLWPLWESLLLFDEHTWGCSDMASQPYSFAARASWAYKAAHIYRAHDDARRLEGELAAALATRQPADGATDYRDATVRETGSVAASLLLANPLPVDWSGPVELPGLSAAHNSLRSPDGALAMVQWSEATPLGPARAFAMPRVAAESAKVWTATRTDVEPRLTSVEDPLVLQNEHYLLRWDECGRLISLVDRDTETELVDPWSPWGFAEVILETIPGHQDRRAVWERDYAAVPYGKRRTDAPFHREGSLAHARLLSRQDGGLSDAVVWQSSLPTVPAIETEIRLWRGLRRIDVELRLEKEPRTAYEGLYCAFPVNLDNPRGFIHSGDAVFEVEKQQLPGTCRDHYAVEHFAALQGDRGWSVLCPVEAPLVQMGQITFGQWADHLRLTRGCMYSWLTNNFWYTNFPGYQQGRLTFRFVLQAGTGELDLAAAEQFARQVRMGLTVG